MSGLDHIYSQCVPLKINLIGSDEVIVREINEINIVDTFRSTCKL